MVRANFVVSVCANEEQIRTLILQKQVSQHLQRGCVEPLEVIEKQNQRMLSSREHPDEATNNLFEHALRVRRRELRARLLPADYALKVRNEAGDQLAIEANCGHDCFTPAGELRLGFAENRLDQAPKRLRQMRIGNVAVVLFELARRK